MTQTDNAVTRKGSQTLYLGSLTGTEDGTIHEGRNDGANASEPSFKRVSIEDMLTILGSCDEKGRFKGAESRDSPLGRHGPQTIVSINYRPQPLAEGQENLDEYDYECGDHRGISLTYRDYVQAGKPREITVDVETKIRKAK